MSATIETSRLSGSEQTARIALIRSVHLAYLCALHAGRPDDEHLKQLLRHALELGYPASGLSTLTTWHCPNLSMTQLDDAQALRQQYKAIVESDGYVALSSAPGLPWITAIELIRAWPGRPLAAERDAFMQETFSACGRHIDFEHQGFEQILASVARACMGDAAGRSPLELARLHLMGDEGPDDDNEDGPDENGMPQAA